MTTTLYINNVLRDDVRVNRIRASYVAPWEAELFYPGRHDAAITVRLWDSVLITDESGTARFRGRVTSIKPGGVAGEGITFTCQDARFRLENEPVRINGRGSYVWNQRGSTCDLGKGGYDCPDRDGMHWTCGQIIVDILEHALGVPSAGSGIPGHHTSPCCVPDPYLSDSDVAGYTASDILALDSICGEFSVDNTPVAQAIGLLMGLNGGYYGWYLDPSTGRFVLVDMDSLPTMDVQAGVLGEWQDKAGTDYRLLDNQLEWSLDGVCSTIIIQGADATAEEQPDNIEGRHNAGKGNLGRLEMVAAPWLSWPACYRAVCQPTRLLTAKEIDLGTPILDPNTGGIIGFSGADEFTPPAGLSGYTHMPRIYIGTVGGPKRVYQPSSGIQLVWIVVSGLIAFFEDPRGVLGPYEKLWGWYFSAVPFTVSAGPDGDAYDCFGYECARTVYDASMRDLTSYPMAAFSSADKDAMAVLAQRLLRQYCNVRRQGTLSLDRADFSTGLGSRYNVVNLTAPAGGLPCDGGPMDWASLAVNAVEVTWDFAEETTEIRVANTFFMLAEYSALKAALEQQIFVQREVNLSQTIYDCQVQAPSAHDPTTHAPFPTTHFPNATWPPSSPPPADDTTPSPDGGSTPPPDDGSTPPPDSGPTPPPDDGSTPPPDSGSTPPSDGGSTPPPDAGSTPPPDGGTTPPPCPTEDCTSCPTHLYSDVSVEFTMTFMGDPTSWSCDVPMTGGSYAPYWYNSYGGCYWASTGSCLTKPCSCDGPGQPEWSDITCVDGYWTVSIGVYDAGYGGVGWQYAVYAKAASPCPDGLYNLVSNSMLSAPSTITIHT